MAASVVEFGWFWRTIVVLEVHVRITDLRTDFESTMFSAPLVGTRLKLAISLETVSVSGTSNLPDPF